MTPEIKPMKQYAVNFNGLPRKTDPWKNQKQASAAPLPTCTELPKKVAPWAKQFKKGA